MSVALMEAAGDQVASHAADPGLVWHLVASHHGYCRPLAPYIPDPQPVAVAFSTDGLSSSCSSRHDLARLDSGIAERFWQVIRRYGWWGAALLETVLRLADQQQSEREQQGDERRCMNLF
jgi:CRISPR-associated endonuclease/helicase Cas3